MHANSTCRVVVEPGGDQVVSHVGLHALGSLADALGLGDALSACIPPRSARLPRHDRGKVLVQAMVMLAGTTGLRRSDTTQAGVPEQCEQALASSRVRRNLF